MYNILKFYELYKTEDKIKTRIKNITDKMDSFKIN